MTAFMILAISLCVLGAALGVVFARNAVVSALCLITAFFGLSGFYVLWDSPFLAAIQVLIYTGAIVVVFVFVVMLIDQDRLLNMATSRVTFAVAGMLAWLLSVAVLRALNRSRVEAIAVGASSNLRSIAKALFQEYLWPFEVLSCFLLVVIVASYVLAREETGEVE